MFAAMHDAMRRDAQRLESTIERSPECAQSRALAAWFGRVAGVIVHHHTVEDEIVWPTIERTCGDFQGDRHRLEHDHHVLDRAMDLVASTLGTLGAGEGQAASEDSLEAAASAASEFTRILDDHLTTEESVAFPLLGHSMDAATYAEMEKRLDRTGSLALAAFALPWVLDGAGASTTSAISTSLPAPMRVLHRFVWSRRYDRFVRSAVGGGR